MSSRKTIFLSLIMVALLPLSCTKLDKMMEEGTETLVEEKLPEDGSIPSEYGNLVSVSSVVAFPDFMQLWFQDEKGDLRMVRYSISANRFVKVSHVVRRKQGGY
jgi:hypothetical protein